MGDRPPHLIGGLRVNDAHSVQTAWDAEAWRIECQCKAVFTALALEEAVDRYGQHRASALQAHLEAYETATLSAVGLLNEMHQQFDGAHPNCTMRNDFCVTRASLRELSSQEGF